MNESLSLSGRVINKEFNEQGTAFNLEVEVSPIQTIMYFDWLPTPECNITIGSNVTVTVEPQHDGSTIASIELDA
jgi:hypothetical protein